MNENCSSTGSSKCCARAAYVAAILGSFLIVFGLVRYMQKATAPAPVNQARVQERKKNLHDLRLENAKVLNTYDWQDQPKGIVRLPVARAMELTLLEYKNPAAARSNLIARADKANVVPPKAPEAPGKYE